ncbi:collagen-like protein [Paenibacillus agilis]|uniref:Collagen-like protein n=1 Tax=Paenibacillus agilis TaxID=3020863 RepID=A0A559J0H3_9BACL|nr:collagen-like protein [Paenibacillus agilis]TVX93389.1 collagen-like protein [Paenibacillus agilis]
MAFVPLPGPGPSGPLMPPPGPPPGLGPGPSFPPPGPGPGPGGGGHQGPTAPPPPFVPQMSPLAVDPGAISRCLFRNTYVWLRNGDSFWFFPTFVGRTSVSGFRFFRGRWMFFGVDLRQIVSFTCF